MSRKQRRRPVVRLLLPAGLLLVGFAAIECRLAQLQLLQHDELAAMAQQEQVRLVQTSPERGQIYDRSSQALATNIASYSLYACPADITDASGVAAQVAKTLPLVEAGELEHVLRKAASFVWVARKLSREQKQQIDALDLPGLGFLEEPQRLYPEGELAAHLLGWVGIDSQGLSGLEYEYDHQLRGEAGKVALKRDALGAYIPFTKDVVEALVPGADLYLTVDARIQAIVEQEVARALASSKARSVEAVFIDPRTGAVVALANKPGYSPNSWTQASYFQRTNRIIQHIYEPGSTFKIITGSALLEEGLMSPEETIYCSEALQFGDHTITDWKAFNQELNFREIMYNSSDVGIIKAAERLDKKVFHQYIHSFGFGQPTGIDYPGEAPGIVKPYQRWYLTDFPCISIGHGIAVTPLQMVVALSAVINGGELLRPFIVERISNPSGKTSFIQEKLVRRHVISPATSALMRQMLADVVIRGTGKQAGIEEYSTGGKTGTAQIPSPGGGYLPGKYVASFTGFAPVGKPQLAGIVLVKEPTGAYYGGEVAAPIFARITQRILPLLGVASEKQLFAKG